MRAEDELKLSFYKEISELPGGGDVHLVKNIESGEIFVKKVLHDYDSEVYSTLANREFPGIPRIYECIENEEGLIIIEEHINGTTLSDIIKKFGTISEEKTIGIASCICQILEPLHSSKPPFIHRDIKPSNIMLTEDGSTYLIDYDGAKQYNYGKARDTELIGTRFYAAPEQYGFSQSDPRTDIFAIGVLMREMLTGSPDNMYDDYSGKLRNIIDKCTSIDPEDRYGDVKELKRELSLAKEHVEDIATGATPGENRNIDSNTQNAQHIQNAQDCDDAQRNGNSQYVDHVQGKENAHGSQQDQNAQHIFNAPQSTNVTNHKRSDDSDDSWRLPGYRSNNKVAIALATIGYVLLAILCITYDDEEYTGSMRIFIRFTLFITFMLYILFYGNYHGIKNRLPLTNSENLIIRIIGYVIYTFAILLIGGTILYIFESITGYSG